MGRYKYYVNTKGLWMFVIFDASGEWKGLDADYISNIYFFKFFCQSLLITMWQPYLSMPKSDKHVQRLLI